MTIEINDYSKKLITDIYGLYKKNKISSAEHHLLLHYIYELKKAITIYNELELLDDKPLDDNTQNRLHLYNKIFFPNIFNYEHPKYLFINGVQTLCSKYGHLILSKIRDLILDIFDDGAITVDDISNIFGPIFSAGCHSTMCADPFCTSVKYYSDYHHQKELYDDYKPAIISASSNDKFKKKCDILLSLNNLLNEFNEDLLVLNEQTSKIYFDEIYSDPDALSALQSIFDKYIPFVKFSPESANELTAFSDLAKTAILESQEGLYEYVFIPLLKKVKIPELYPKKNQPEITFHYKEDTPLPTKILNEKAIQKIKELYELKIIPEKEGSVFLNLIEKLGKQKTEFEEKYGRFKKDSEIDIQKSDSFPSTLGRYDIKEALFPNCHEGIEARYIIRKDLMGLFQNMQNKKYKDYFKTMLDIYAILVKISKYDVNIEAYASYIEHEFSSIYYDFDDLLYGQHAFTEFMYNGIRFLEENTFLYVRPLSGGLRGEFPLR